ncbi:MAG: tetratricopeptide repeat protein [Spirochaetales bacterium]
MASPKLLVRSERLLRAGKFSQVISRLEPQVFRYRDNFAFYRILGTACLYAGDFGGAFSYLQRAYQMNPKDTGVALGLAAAQLRRKNVPEALKYWLDILDREPSNKRAKRGLALVKRIEDPADLVPLAESGKLDKLFPPLGTRLPTWVPVAGLVLVAAFVTAIWVVPLVGELLDRPRDQRRGLEEIAPATLPEELTSPDASARYRFSEDEIEQIVEQIGLHFNAFEDNLARREANRILLSNANPLVKERVRLLISYLQEPTFATFERGFSFAEVEEEPWLYEGCFVRWGGATSNISLDDDAIRFVMLVGYEDERILEGTVPVTVPFVADVEPGTVEVLGRIDLSGDDFELTAVSIRKTVRR